ncbi:hypothetical protein SAMD00023353_0500990 [Rosellinia necatrix]|uniref:Biogenesis of lysosome-related organelles complex 1 subunit 1 n=1 Tax=Rosellinia necatrix TaxID=77044 RepID=A0A1S7UK97_ROSNE|nr:hypothetical protein SAMD00023353_0500990 [Rosellinia necatrix]
MSDPVAASRAHPPPAPASRPEERRRSSTASSSPNDHAASCSVMASAGSSLCPIMISPPSLPSSTSKALPSVSGSRLTATSPPTTISDRSAPVLIHGTGIQPGGGTSTATMSSANSDLSPRDSQLHVAEARAALVASMSNMLDSELQSRASILHANAAVLSRQEEDVARATEALRKENDKLAKAAKDAGRKIKELGNVQNWAEVLERDFLVLEETMRLVRDGGAESDGDDSCSDCSGSYWSEGESEGDGDAEGGRGGTMVGSPTGSLRGSVGKLVEETGALGKRSGKGSVLDSGSSTVGEESTASNTSQAGSALGLLSSCNATVSLDEAILDSLAEALATDIRMELAPTAQNCGTARTL